MPKFIKVQAIMVDRAKQDNQEWVEKTVKNMKASTLIKQLLRLLGMLVKRFSKKM
jgi:hypothetical protein